LKDVDMTKHELLNLRATFCWDFGQLLFIETHEGNFVWSDPDYYGDNIIHPTSMSAEQFCRYTGVPYLRHKGKSTVAAKCGNTFILIDEEFV